MWCEKSRSMNMRFSITFFRWFTNIFITLYEQTVLSCPPNTILMAFFFFLSVWIHVYKACSILTLENNDLYHAYVRVHFWKPYLKQYIMLLYIIFLLLSFFYDDDQVKGNLKMRKKCSILERKYYSMNKKRLNEFSKIKW